MCLQIIKKTFGWVGGYSPLLLLALFLASNGETANLRELIKQSRQLIGDSPYYTGGSSKISDSRIIYYLNEGQDYAAAYSWAFHKRTSFDLVSGTTEYNLPTDFQTTQRVTLDNTILAERTLQALDDEGVNWLSQEGKPVYYYIRTTTVSYIGFNPFPNTSSDTGTIVMDYISHTLRLDEPNDVPFNGLPDYYILHDTLPKFVAYRFFLSIGNTGLADIYAKEYASDIKRLKEIMETKPNYRPGFRSDQNRR